MAAYPVAGIKSIADQAGFDDYRSRVGATMEPYGAKFLAGAAAEHVEGTWQPMVRDGRRVPEHGGDATVV